MKLLLVGVYGDGSNAHSMLENPLLTYTVPLGANPVVLEAAVCELRAALTACRLTHGSYSDYFIILEPDEA